MAITELGNSASNIDIYKQNNPGKTIAPKLVRKTLPALEISDGLCATELDCLVIPSPYISKYQAHIQWNAYDIATTPFPPSDPGEAVARTFVNEEELSKGQLRVLRPGDVIAFHEPNTTEQLCKWEVKRIAYGGLQPLNRSGDCQEELAKLRQIGAKWSLDIPTVMVTVVAMAILGGLLIRFLPDVSDDFIN